MESYYVGWLVWDARLLSFVLLISVFLMVGIVVFVFWGCRWYEYVIVFVSIFVVILFIIVFIFNEIVDYFVFFLEDVFFFL